MMLLNNTTENESINACGEEMDAVGIDEAPSILSVETEVINDFDMQRTFTKRVDNTSDQSTTLHQATSYDTVLKECEMELNGAPSTENDTMMSINEAPSILSVETEIADNLETPSISNRKKRDQEATAYPPSPKDVPPPIPIDRSMPPNYSYARSITPTPSVAPSVASNMSRHSYTSNTTQEIKTKKEPRIKKVSHGIWANVSNRVRSLRLPKVSSVDDSASLHTNFTTQTGVDTVGTNGTVKTNETSETCPARVETYDSSSVEKKADIEVICRDVAACYIDLMFDAIYIAFLYLNRDEVVRQQHKFNIFAIVLLVVSILGLVLSFWAIAASLERKYRGTMRLYGCTVPRLNICLVILHHMPVIVVSRDLSLFFLVHLDAHKLTLITSLTVNIMY